MTALSCHELCRLFCCPPCPDHIAAKLAFIPPPPTYSVSPDGSTGRYNLCLTERAEWQYSDREQQSLEVKSFFLIKNL